MHTAKRLTKHVRTEKDILHRYAPAIRYRDTFCASIGPTMHNNYYLTTVEWCVCVCVRACVGVCVCAYTCMCLCVRACLCVCAYMRACVRACVRAGL